jgi:glutamate/tyrosine decarboxylase-like PLP-dependent enzyme
MKKLGYDIPPFDFQVDGVTSMSCDIHKYGYTAKGASVVLHKTKELRKHQFFVYSDWTGGIYGSPSVTGTRSGGSIAAAWCAINHMGINGYMEMTKTSMVITEKIKNYINNHKDLNIIGDPVMCIFAIDSRTIDIYSLGDELMVKDWFIDKQQFPPSLHLSINQHHKISVDALIEDIGNAVEKAKSFSWSNLNKQIQIKAVESLKSVLPNAYFKKFKSFAASNSDIGSKRTAAMYGMMGTLREDDQGMDVMVMEFLDKLNSLE